MSTALITKAIWPELTKAARASKQPCSVAVAYFGAGAGRLLPLTPGSHLVVDASERAVATGQTCPADLIKLLKRGISVYSVPNLHAKVFVLGRAAYIGSANVSNHSAARLIEAVIRTTEGAAVNAARRFVREHCLHELTPTVLKRLQALYRPPIVPGARRAGKTDVPVSNSRQPALPRLLLAKLKAGTLSDSDQSLHDEALPVAAKRRQHAENYAIESFCWTGKCNYQRGDVVIQVTKEITGKVLVSPPGNVLHVRSRRNAGRQVSFVFLEVPIRRRRPVTALAGKLGAGALEKLRKGGVVRNAAFAQALLNAWAT